jgi:hypothetical protein
MLQFLNPIWMITVSAVALPLLIHLWNLRKGKRLKIGSLLLITQSIQPTARQLRLTEWLLLLLRCLLILLLALLLSGPYWQNKSNNNKQKGWILIPRETIGDIYPAFKTQIDSLIKDGFELHAFNYPFEPINTDATNAGEGRPVSYWQRLAQLNNRLGAGFPVIIFSSGSMEHFKGERPEVSLAVQWQVLRSTNDRSQLVKATKLGTDSIALKLLKSNAQKNIFTEQHIAANTSTTEWKITQTDTGSFIQWQQQAPLKIDTGVLRITVFQRSKQQDARYLHAALESIRPLLDQPLLISDAKDAASIPPGQDWVFWLTEDSIHFDRSNHNYFVYAKGEIAGENSNMFTAASTSTASFEIYKRIKQKNSDGIIWTDGYGKPLLTKNARNAYHFYSRFDPSWNNLVWNAAFPELIFDLLQHDRSISIVDLRQIDTAQLSFKVSPGILKTTGIADQTDLSAICWWLLLLCFAAERWFALHPKTKARAA